METRVRIMPQTPLLLIPLENTDNLLPKIYFGDIALKNKQTKLIKKKKKIHCFENFQFLLIFPCGLRENEQSNPCLLIGMQCFDEVQHNFQETISYTSSVTVWKLNTI